MRTLSVLCPVYNEEEVIAEFHRSLSATLDSIASRYQSEIIFVLDRSTDRTLEILRDIAARDPRVRVLALSSRFGHQMSLVAGIDHATGDAVVMLDSDLQHPPELIPSMLEKFEEGYDIVFTIREDAPDTGFLRRMASRLFYRLVNKLTTVPIEESAADFRLISRRVAEVFRTQIRERNQFLRGLFGWVGFKKVGLRFTGGARHAGRSKYSLSRLLRFATEGVISFSKRPLSASIYLGFTFALLGLLLAVATFIQYFFYSYLPSGWTTIVILISMFSGVQLVFLGVIGEYVGLIFDEVKARPRYLVEESIGFRDDRP